MKQIMPYVSTLLLLLISIMPIAMLAETFVPYEGISVSYMKLADGGIKITDVINKSSYRFEISIDGETLTYPPNSEGSSGKPNKFAYKLVRYDISKKGGGTMWKYTPPDKEEIAEDAVEVNSAEDEIVADNATVQPARSRKGTRSAPNNGYGNPTSVNYFKLVDEDEYFGNDAVDAYVTRTNSYSDALDKSSNKKQYIIDNDLEQYLRESQVMLVEKKAQIPLLAQDIATQAQSLVSDTELVVNYDNLEMSRDKLGFNIGLNFNKYIYVLVIFLISFILAIFVEKADPAFLYLTPFVLIALYLQAFFKKRVVLPVYIISLLPLLVFSHNGLELFLMNLVAGVVAIYVFIYFNKGWQQFVTALCVFLVLMVVYLGFRLIDGIKGFDDYRTIFFMFLGSFLIVAGYPLIYLFERMFMLVSSSRLIELCDTNSKPLLELAHKAPGTFQHCLQVMNMADAAAKSIGADVPLVRAGALYHDIGKTLNPQCFIENDSTGTNYHQGLTPLESAKEIIKHVPDGLSLADKYGLPDEIKQFIVTHHGTTCTAYFYNKYINAGGDPDKADDFYYTGSKPKTPEQVILMLCDTLEAASRTLKDYTPKSISSLVEGVVRSKMEAGQFEDADITLRELNTIKSVMKDYIQQIHHARVVYPKRNPPVKSS